MKLEIISKYPAIEQCPTPLLFIHGTLHTASCWDVHFLEVSLLWRYPCDLFSVFSIHNKGL
jgi:hypothetical protein